MSHSPDDEEEDDIEDGHSDDAHERFTDLGCAVRREPEWVVNPLFPVGLCILGAPPKSGKSTLTMVAAAAVADLAPKALPPDLLQVPQHGKVLVFSYEADDGELRVMMEDGIHVKVPADGRIKVCTDPWAFRLDDVEGRDELIQVLNEEEPLLVIADPFRDMHDQEEKESSQMIQMLRPIREWAVKAHACFLMCHHTTKVTEETTTYEAKHLRGSGAIFGKADGIVMLTPQIDGKTEISCTFKRGKAWRRTLQLALYDTATASEPLTERDELVLRGLKGGGNYEEIARQLRIGKLAVQGCVAKLLRNGYLIRSGKKIKINRKKEIVR